jgi:hypothetical protein
VEGEGRIVRSVEAGVGHEKKATATGRAGP